MKITHLFTDLGGVLLTNGWDRGLRKLVATHFDVDAAEMDERHHLTYDTYEAGKISLSVYLRRVIFWEPRDFTEEAVVEFMLSQAKSFPEMIELYKRIKANNEIKIVVVSNEGRELTADRIRRFNLKEFVDIFVVSSYRPLPQAGRGHLPPRPRRRPGRAGRGGLRRRPAHVRRGGLPAGDAGGLAPGSRADPGGVRRVGTEVLDAGGRWWGQGRQIRRLS